MSDPFTYSLDFLCYLIAKKAVHKNLDALSLMDKIRKNMEHIHNIETPHKHKQEK